MSAPWRCAGTQTVAPARGDATARHAPGSRAPTRRASGPLPAFPPPRRAPPGGRGRAPAPPGGIDRPGAAEENLPATLVHAWFAAESGYDPRAVSPQGAVGLMQLMPAPRNALDCRARRGPTRHAICAPARATSLVAEHLPRRSGAGPSGYNAGEGAGTKIRQPGSALSGNPTVRAPGHQPPRAPGRRTCIVTRVSRCFARVRIGVVVLAGSNRRVGPEPRGVRGRSAPAGGHRRPDPGTGLPHRSYRAVGRRYRADRAPVTFNYASLAGAVAADRARAARTYLNERHRVVHAARPRGGRVPDAAALTLAG